jgi:RNA polymerase sigma-70 factor (ECF subfamily)
MEIPWPPAGAAACALPAMPKAVRLAPGAAVAPSRGLELTTETAAQFALMRRCQADEPGAFEELVRQFSPRVNSAIRGILRNSNDAEDVAQQVFAKVYFSRRRFDFRSAVATWIYKIAVNECYDHLRKQRVRRAVLLADLSEQEAARIANLDPAAAPVPAFGASAPVGVARQVETREIAAKLLAALPPEDRILLVMKEVEGHSIQELAEILGLNENTVKVKLFRARQKLLARIKRKLI